jgi:TonB family protein
MSALSMPDPRKGPEDRAFRLAALAALALEAGILALLGLSQAHWLGRPGHAADAAEYIEAQVMPMPEEAHLVSQDAAASVPEEVLSKEAGKGKKPKPGQKPIQDQNQTQAGPALGATHGVVALYAPAPVIPAYLRDQMLKASVVIEFTVTAAGQASPRLLSSSGNEELDAIALGTVRKWRFAPAEQEHHPMDSKTRLRIMFEVY